MKYGILSIIISLIGILFVIWYNFEIAELFQNEMLKLNNMTEINSTIFMSSKLNIPIALGLALVGVLLGIKSIQGKNKIGILGISLSLILFILIFTPIWQYVLSDSALDINFKN